VRVYWDSSALVVATMDSNVRQCLLEPDQFSRPHALAEVFSTLTGGRLGFRLDATDAASVIAQLGDSLQFVELEVLEIVSALNSARNLGVRGGRVHDFLHAVAAIKAECEVLRTLNTPDFQGLFAGGKLEGV
jgi:hypothetical protein